MDTEKIIYILITVILSVLSRKYLEPILPDKKKMIYFIKVGFTFIFKYVISVFFIIYSYLKSDFDKFYVLANAILISNISVQIVIDLLKYMNTKQSKTMIKLVDMIKDINENIVYKEKN